MDVEVTNSQAVLCWHIYILKGEIFVRGTVQIKDVDGRVVHCDLDSMDLGLLIGVNFEIGGRNVVSDKH